MAEVTADGFVGTISAMTTIDQFWAKVNKTDSCWLWTGLRTESGYGHFWMNGRYLRAHRVAYELTNGPIADGLEIDHLCRVRHCVNPDHLEAVSHQENHRRAKEVKTHCRNGHLLAGDNLITQGPNRRCRICKRDADVKSARKQRGSVDRGTLAPPACQRCGKQLRTPPSGPMPKWCAACRQWRYEQRLKGAT